MKKNSRLKSIVASILVTIALAAPVVVLSTAADPHDAELLFEILDQSQEVVSTADPAVTATRQNGLVFHADGSVQLLVNVGVDEAVNCRGAAFHLSYNPDYLTPSDFTTNKPITTQGSEDKDNFFRPDVELLGPEYAGKNIQVFQKSYFDFTAFKAVYYSRLDTAMATIDMDLWFDNNAIRTAVGKGALTGKLRELSHITEDRDEKIYVFNKRDSITATNQTPGQVYLGQLSFQVKRDRLAEVLALFDNLDVYSNYAYYPETTPDRPLRTPRTPGGTPAQPVHLIDINQDYITGTEDPWQVSYYYASADGLLSTRNYVPNEHTNVADHYRFLFNGDLIVDVELTNPDFTINAYQNYTAGTVDDLTVSMGRWAGMVTVTHADGTRTNEPFPWGRSSTVNNNYTRSYIKRSDQKADTAWRDMTPRRAVTPYDPTAN